MGLLQPTTSGAGTLNVLLHGTFAFKVPDGATEITAFIPNLEHHVYRAGNWLAETDLRPEDSRTTYRLRGVKAGTETLSKSTNLIVKSGSEPIPDPYAAIVFPLPKKIASLRVADVPSSEFYDPERLLMPDVVENMASLQIFSFDIEDEADLRLETKETGEGHFWEPAFSGDYVNLHIFSTEDFYDRPSVAPVDINAALALLGVKLRMKPTAFSATKGIRADEVLPDGVRPEETEDLALRTKRMARLGRLVLQNGDANQAWYPNDALDGNPPGCSGCGGN